MSLTRFMDFNRIDDEDIIVTVEFEITPGEFPSWEDPGCGPIVEIIGAHTPDGKEITLTTAEIAKFTSYIEENCDDDDGPDPDDERERRQDASFGDD